MSVDLSFVSDKEVYDAAIHIQSAILICQLLLCDRLVYLNCVRSGCEFQINRQKVFTVVHSVNFQ